ncbi:hypothetical protein [Amycolatopsis sp. BJA-103]|uniref:hypothetical protein n=1 Tax=Amycolatopsis sp. BJA-103 TaxID=1911175 RepID=UPI000C7801C7|nr:hypothetical protein [Amycolatopsis sp. BJA-103]AUI56808.1 hypothetical protein BKN51_00325 [Amycolatopsis sp. BJA-103]PNE13451.1 hypothetical protein B1H26_40195 [Amycolatopsis sp. BJA-103]
MTDEEPRRWRKGDPEPADHPDVSDRYGDAWSWYPTGVWVDPNNPTTHPCSWEYIARKFYPLTEKPKVGAR